MSIINSNNYLTEHDSDVSSVADESVRFGATGPASVTSMNAIHQANDFLGANEAVVENMQLIEIGDLTDRKIYGTDK